MNEKTVQLNIRISPALLARIRKQSKKEGRSEAAFIRRVLDRYILEKEFRDTSNANVAVAAQETIDQNRKLLELLRNS